MERNRETRRASILDSNGFNRRRHRTNTIRDYPDEDGGVELEESVRLRDRVKTDRYRERERERDLRERLRSKRRRGVDETSEEESFNDDDDEDYEDEESTTATTAVARLLPPPPGAVSNHHYSYSSSNNHHPQHIKSFPPGFSSSSSSSKGFRASPVWKPGDEIISVSVPRKARSVNTKRSHDWISSSSNNINGGGSGKAEQVLRQESTSPARHSGGASTSMLKPAKASPKKKYSNPEELEIEIAEVLYGLMTQSQGPSSKKVDPKEVNRSNGNEKSSPIPNSSSLQAVPAPKRKRPTQLADNSGCAGGPGPVPIKVEINPALKSGISSPNPDRIAGCIGEIGFEVGGNSVNSDMKPPAQPPEADKFTESADLAIKEDKETCVLKNEDGVCNGSSLTETASLSVPDTMIKANSMVPQVEFQKEQKFEIDLMAPPPRVQSYPETGAPLDPKPNLTTVDANSEKKSANVTSEEKESKGTSEETEQKKEIENCSRTTKLQFDLEKSEINENTGNKLQQQEELPIKANKEDPLTEKSGQSESSAILPLPVTTSGLPRIGYMSPLQGVIPMDGTTVTPSPLQPLFNQPRPKRCATHCYIAKNIHSLEQFAKINQVAPGPASLFGSKLCNLNVVVPLDPGRNVAGTGVNNVNKSNLGVKDKGSENATSSDSAHRKQQMLVQQMMPSVRPSNLLGPSFIFPLNQQQAVASATARPSSPRPPPPTTTTGVTASSNLSSSYYPPMAAPNGTQYLAILQNSGYPFPIPSDVVHTPNYQGPAPQPFPLFNGCFYPSQMIHPSQIHQHHQAPPTQPSQMNFLRQQQPRPESNGVINDGLRSANSQHRQHPSRPRQLESKPDREGSPASMADSRGSWAPVKSIYGPDFAMSIQAQQPQQPAMSFGTINGTNTVSGDEIRSMAQNHPIFKSFPEAATQNIQKMAATAAQNNNNFSVSEDTKSGNAGSSTYDAGRNKAETQSSVRSLNVSSVGAARTSQPVTSNDAIGAINVPNVHHIQGQLQQQLKQQQQMAFSRSNMSVTSNGPEHLNSNLSSIMAAAKFSNVLPNFPQYLIQSNNNGPAQTWKKSSTTRVSQTQSSSTTTPKSQHFRPLTQTHNEISFGGNPKPATNSQGQAPTSPTNSSVSKESSRTSSTSTNTKTGQNPNISARQPRTSPSVLGNSNAARTPTQPQVFFSNPCSQVQSPHSTSTSSASSGLNRFHMQRRQPEQQQQQPGPPTYSTGVLSLCTPMNTSTNDPAKAIAAANSNVKGDRFNPHGIIHTAQYGVPSGGTLLPVGFSYVHPVQVKPAEQKQPAGNEILQAWQPEKK